MRSKVLLIVGVLIAVMGMVMGGGLTSVNAAIGQYARNRQEGPAPDRVVDIFYDEYIAAIDRDEMQTSPLAERSYRTSPYLHADCISRVDALLDAFDSDSAHGAYDPFLQAQDVPAYVMSTESTVLEDMAYVVVVSSFERHSFLVTLTDEAGAWQILAMTSTPAQTVESFYSWYMAREDSPLVTGEYREHALLSDDFVNEVMLAAASDAGSDPDGRFNPFFLAQGVPVNVRVVESALARSTAKVAVDFTWQGEIEAVRRYVALSLDVDRWVIDDVTAE